MSDSPPFCPCCGYNLKAETPLVAGRFSYDPGDGVFVDGRRLIAEPRVHEMLSALMSAGGRYVRRETLYQRMHGDYENSTLTITAYISGYYTKIKKLMKKLDTDLPIENKYGVGMRWCGPRVYRQIEN